MADHSALDREGAGSNPVSGFSTANPGYAAFQLARAFTTSSKHDDPATRVRAEERARKWAAVLEGMLGGSLTVGSRRPVAYAPEWVTLEVVTGGFATGGKLAGGPLADWERELASSLGIHADGDNRLGLNRYFLTDQGLSELQRRLSDDTYAIDVPEEAALLVLAWLLMHGHAELARELLDEISGYMGELRFYPRFVDTPLRTSSTVFVQDVKSTLNALEAVRPHAGIAAQQEAIRVWIPIYDDAVRLLLETVGGPNPDLLRDGDGNPLPRDAGRWAVTGGWPLQTFPDGWARRATELVHRFDAASHAHRLTSRATSKKSSLAALLPLLRKAANDPARLSGKEVGLVRLILARFLASHGLPDSDSHSTLRSHQDRQASTIQFAPIARCVGARLQPFPKDEGIEDIAPILRPLTDDEASSCGAPSGTLLPETIHRKAERCLTASVEELVSHGIITSGDVIAKVLPQFSAGVRAAAISDPSLKNLYAATYRAFRRRRSLLLLDLQSQVRMEELPWVKPVESFRNETRSTREISRQVLCEVLVTTLTAFPYAILPNKLLQEIRALAKGASIEVPILDDLAADIFMGEFSPKFVQAAKRAGELLDGSTYAKYYQIDYRQVAELKSEKSKRTKWLSWGKEPDATAFASLCAERAGVELGDWDPAINGMIIEQQQIITTQNLAPLVMALGLQEELGPHLVPMARSCFEWILRRMEAGDADWHAKLIAIKNSAYAWRQMVFLLSLAPMGDQRAHIEWMYDRLVNKQTPFRTRFARVVGGFANTVNSTETTYSSEYFRGWSKARDWLLDGDTSSSDVPK